MKRRKKSTTLNVPNGGPKTAQELVEYVSKGHEKGYSICSECIIALYEMFSMHPVVGHRIVRLEKGRFYGTQNMGNMTTLLYKARAKYGHYTQTVAVDG